MSQGNESRFSATANYFVPTAGNGGGSVLESTVIITPQGGTATINNALVGGVGSAGSQLELGPSTTNYKALTIYDNGAATNGVGININSSEPSVAGLNIVGPGAATPSAYIRINTLTGGESLTLASNANVNNIVLTPATTTVNSTLTTAQGGDVINGGVYRRTNTVNNQAVVVPCPECNSGADAPFPIPPGLLPGLYAVLVGNGTTTPNGASYGGGLMYWNGSIWSAGGWNNNPSSLTSAYGVHILSSNPGLPVATQLVFTNGTTSGITAGQVAIYFCLLMAGPLGGQLAPFV